MNIRRAICFGLLVCILPQDGLLNQALWANAVQPDTKDPFFNKSSSLAVGAKGEEALDVSIEPQCGETLWVFDRAQVVVNRNRFGDVRLVQLPEVGCVDCRPLKVRWYHEPTGYLDFSVRIWRRQKHFACETKPSSTTANN